MGGDGDRIGVIREGKVKIHGERAGLLPGTRNRLTFSLLFDFLLSLSLSIGNCDSFCHLSLRHVPISSKKPTFPDVPRILSSSPRNRRSIVPLWIRRLAGGEWHSWWSPPQHRPTISESGAAAPPISSRSLIDSYTFPIQPPPDQKSQKSSSSSSCILIGLRPHVLVACYVWRGVLNTGL